VFGSYRAYYDQHRAWQRGCVPVPTRVWPGCDLTLRLAGRQWYGLGHGHGRLCGKHVLLEAAGRGRAERPRQVSTTSPPPSLVERVGRLPGDIPGLRVTPPAPPWEESAAPDSTRTAAEASA
jgi:hypothetical protein